MDRPIEDQAEPGSRTAPRWIRIGVWVSIAFLTASVIMGMFLY